MMSRIRFANLRSQTYSFQICQPFVVFLLCVRLEVSTAVTKRKGMPSAGILRRVALVRTDVSEEFSASIIKVTKNGELGTTLAVTSNQACAG
jgi:hypothetical protein